MIRQADEKFIGPALYYYIAIAMSLVLGVVLFHSRPAGVVFAFISIWALRNKGNIGLYIRKTFLAAGILALLATNIPESGYQGLLRPEARVFALIGIALATIDFFWPLLRKTS